MNFDLTEEQRMIRDTAREFAEKEVKPAAAEIDRTDEFPWKIYRRMAELGLVAMTLPSEYGGSGRTRSAGPSWKRNWPGLPPRFPMPSCSKN